MISTTKVSQDVSFLGSLIKSISNIDVFHIDNLFNERIFYNIVVDQKCTFVSIYSPIFLHIKNFTLLKIVFIILSF